MRTFLVSLFSIILVSVAFGNSADPPNGYAGNPPNSYDCTQCHNSYPVNSGDGSLVLTGLPPDGYQSSGTYFPTITLQDPGQLSWGFELTVQYQVGSNYFQAGYLSVLQPDYTQLSQGAGNAPDYLKQTLEGTFPNTPGPTSWSFVWIAPDDSVGTVTFYLAGCAANNNRTVSGDYIYTASYSVSPYAPAQPPVVGDIPDQTINAGGNFTLVMLDDFVDDPDTPDSLIVWTYTGNVELIVDIIDRIANITTPNSNWYGTETVTFIATDPDSLSDSDDAVFTVNNLPPAVGDIPDQTIYMGETFTPIDLNQYVNDPNNPPDQIVWSVSGNVVLQVNILNGIATIIVSDTTWYGSEALNFIATDPGGLSDSDSALFTVLQLGVIKKTNEILPQKFCLNQNYPNPFNANTTISFDLTRETYTVLSLFDIDGKEVSRLINQKFSAGSYEFSVNLEGLSSGIYFCVLKTESFSDVKKMILIK